MAGALKQYDNDKFDLSYYKALAWGGLEGTSSFTALSTAEKGNNYKNSRFIVKQE